MAGPMAWAEYAWTRLSDPLDGPFVAHVKALARRLSIALAVGFMRRGVDTIDGADASSLYPPLNSVVVVDRTGEIVYTYDKVRSNRVACLSPRQAF